jgi:hypothetical protein
MAWQIGDTLAAWRTRNATTFAPTTPPVVGASAPVTAYDATTGRLAIGGVEMGDTGWRVFNSTNSNVTSSSVRVRRIGSTIMLDFVQNIVCSDTSSSASDPIDLGINLGTGWRPLGEGNQTHALLQDNASSQRHVLITGTAQIQYLWRQAYPGSGSFHTGRDSVQYSTSDTWPASLPGALGTAPLTVAL